MGLFGSILPKPETCPDCGTRYFPKRGHTCNLRINCPECDRRIFRGQEHNCTPRKPPEVDLTSDAYARWLRAQRPQPIGWFLGLDELAQEALARLGDDYVAGCIEMGASVAEEDETAALKRMGAEAARDLLGRSGSRADGAALSMGGLTERKEQRARAEQQARNGSKSFLGRRPDGNPPTPESMAAPEVEAE